MESAGREKAPSETRRHEPARARRSQPSLGEALASTMVKQLNSRQGQQLVRGILGSLFKGR